MSHPLFSTRKAYATFGIVPAILKPLRMFGAETAIDLAPETILHFCSFERGIATFDVLSGQYGGRKVTVEEEHLSQFVQTDVQIFVGDA